MADNMVEESRMPSAVLIMDSPIGTPDFRAERIRRLIDGVTQTSFVRTLSIASLGFKGFQIAANVVALFLSRNLETHSPFRLFIVVYTVFVAINGASFLYRYWRYIFNREPLDFAQGAEATLFNNLLDLFTLFLYFVGFKWLQEYQTGSREVPLLFYLTKIWVFYGVLVLLAPIFSIIIILVLLGYMKPSLPVVEYKAGGKIKEEDAQCTICFSNYAQNEKIRKLPCRHHFHMACIDEWFRIDDVCPLCKKSVNPLYDIVGCNI